MLSIGKAIMMARATSERKKNGVAPIKMSSKLTSASATPFTPNTLRPTGGVIRPTCMARIIDMAYHIGSMPMASTAG